jgi:catechol 2,3-dioxygenase-like lactoylglutathione lyase family enzyme
MLFVRTAPQRLKGKPMSELSYEGRTVFCADVAASATYYEKVLGLRRAYEADGDICMTLPVVDHPEAQVTLYLHHAVTPTPIDLGNFRVPDVDAFIARYRAAGYPVVTEPADTPWGTREAAITDLDGNGLLVTASS